jgi:hypothetical protein
MLRLAFDTHQRCRRFPRCTEGFGFCSSLFASKEEILQPSSPRESFHMGNEAETHMQFHVFHEHGPVPRLGLLTGAVARKHTLASDVAVLYLDS